jgi:hypothetical protein
MFGRKAPEMISPEQALVGRTDQTMPVPEAHFVNGASLTGPWPEHMDTLVGAHLLANTWSAFHFSWLCRWLHTKPQL